MPRVERLRVRAALRDPASATANPVGMATRSDRSMSLPEIDTCIVPLPDRRVPGARGLRLLRHRLPRPSRPAAHPDARGLRRLAAAPRLPDRRRAGDLHPQRARSPAVVRMSATLGRRRRLLAHRGPGDRQLAGGAHRRRRGARARAGADDDQHGPAPPGHPRGAAPAGQPRGRGRPRPEADRRLRPHGDREELRGQVLLEGDPVRGADGLPLLLLQHGGVRAAAWSACSSSRSRRAPSTCG